MKSQIALGLALALLLVLSACSAAAGRQVEDRAGLIAALKAAGVQVETGDPISQPFFTPEGQTLLLNGDEIQVFEYESSQALESEVTQVAADGGSVGTTMIDWLAPPHFYKSGRILVLYIGDDPAILDLLSQLLGPQFAGR